MYKIKYSINFFIILILSLILIDFIITHYLNKSSKNIYNIYDNGFYELKKNSESYEIFGSSIFKVKTNNFGFRVDPDLKEENKYDYIIIGDSFVYGMSDFEKSIGGILNAKYDLNILNGGTPSYSPLGYKYILEKAINSGLLNEEFKIILSIDISDLQDEASIWEKDKNNNIRKMCCSTSENIENKNFKNFIIKNFKFSLMLYRNIIFFFNKDYLDPIFNTSRSAFTWKKHELLEQFTAYEGDNLTRGYLPLGIKGGSEKLKRNIISIVDLAKSNKSEVYLLIYPWPAQIKYENKYFDWSKYINEICFVSKCDGVIDLFNYFKNYKLSNQDWYKDLYLNGDIHFNQNGNEIIANKIYEKIN